jgi:hypothetical protein
VKYIAVGAALVFVIYILLVAAFVRLWGWGNLTEALSLSLMFLSAMACATILGYLTAAKGAQKAAVIGGIAAALPLTITAVFAPLNYLFFAALIALGGAICGAAGADLKQIKLRRQYVT